MKTILSLKCSANGDKSASNILVDEFVAELLGARSDLRLVEHDLDSAPLPHVTALALAGIGRAAPTTPDTATAQILSDQLIGELKDAEIVIIGAPMYNFGIPSTLKSWFDYVIRAGQTFQYTATGPQGLIAEKPVIVIETRGGVYSQGLAMAFDCQEPHLRALLGLMGLTQVEFIRVEGLAMGDADVKLSEARRTFGSLEALAQYR